jgi:hypothetical protein
LPLFAFAQAMNSARLPAGTLGAVTNTSGASTPRMIGWNWSIDQRALGKVLGAISANAWVPSQMMEPSAGWSTMYCAAMLPLAPGLFSMMIGCPSVRAMCSAITRA